MNHWLGRKHSPETIEKMRTAKLGIKQSAETKRRISLGLRGRVFSEEHKKKIAEAQKGEKGNNWKGEKAKYSSVHWWVRRTFGRPTKCERCLRHFPTRLVHWANKSGRYARERTDWIRLCYWCHRAFDRAPIPKRLHSHK